MKTSKPATVFLAIFIALALLTAAIAAPILCRPFYYAHIGPLKLVERTGLTEEEIKTAFDEMLDYCLGAEEFSTGVLKWSESGKSHFTDVRVLFLLDLRVRLSLTWLFKERSARCLLPKRLHRCGRSFMPTTTETGSRTQATIASSQRMENMTISVEIIVNE